MSPYVQPHAFSMLRLNPPFGVLSESERTPEPGIWMGNWLNLSYKYHYIDRKINKLQMIKCMFHVHACRLCCKGSKQRPRPMCLFGSLEAHFQGASHLLGPRQKQMATVLILKKATTKGTRSRKISTIWECEGRWNHLKPLQYQKQIKDVHLLNCLYSNRSMLAEIRGHFSTLSTNLNGLTAKTRFIPSNLNILS